MTPARPILFFVRGRGRGHAAVAHAVTEALAIRGFGAPVQFVSYASGVRTLIELGREVIDAGLDERNSLVDSVVPAGDLIRSRQPSLVVAHEEFAVPLAAKILRTPCAFLTDWFSDPSHSNMRALAYVDEVLFIDEPGIFEEPPYLRGRIRYLGPVLRQSAYTARDRVRARRELGIAENELAVAVFIHPGRRDETVAPICGTLLPALDLIGRPRKILWLTEPDDALTAMLAGRAEASVLAVGTPFGRLMAAADLAITKGNRNIVLELASFGVPTISFSHGLNRIDDIRTSRVPGNATLAASRLTAAGLADQIKVKLEQRSHPDAEIHPVHFRNGAEGVASRLLELLATPA